MSKLKNRILQLIEKNAAGKVATLAGQYVQAKPQEKEAIQAGIDIERWLAETARQCLRES